MKQSGEEARQSTTRHERRHKLAYTCTYGSTKCVADNEFPLTSEELGQTTDANSHPDDDIRDENVSCLDVVQGQNQGRGSEREETTADMVRPRDALDKRRTYRGPGFAMRLMWGLGP